jgi:hypothetical protein
MDYGRVSECGSDIELHLWTGEEVTAAEQARREVWTGQLPGEAELYGSLAQLIGRYRDAPNGRLASEAAVRSRWDGAQRQVEYEYVVSLTPPT